MEQTFKEIREQLAQRIFILDGAMGTRIQAFGLSPESFHRGRFASWPVSLVGNNDVLCLTEPDVIKQIHRLYIEAGADIIVTGTQVVARRSTARDAVADALVRRCRALIEANVGRSFNVADLVASLGVSRRTLETRFRAATGRSLNAEITDLRIRRAKTMLAKSSMSQAAIAAACGFCDASHLNVIFRRHCGAPPSAFREN